MIPDLRGTPFDVVGVVDGAAFDALLAGCRSVLLVGNGGPAMFQAFDEALRREPGRYASPHPLDAWVAETLTPRLGGPGRRVVWCAATEQVFLDFRRLALAAGLGWSSRLGLVLHPRYGPWWALRAAVLTTERWVPSAPLSGPGPCEGCPAPCQGACVGEAFRPARDIARCVQAMDGPCRAGCASRRACPVGAAWAYPARAEAWHQHPDARKPESPG